MWFATSTLYPVFFEVWWNGATPGKRLCHLAVVHGDGTPVGWTAAFLRNVVRIADAAPLGYAFGLVCMLCDRDLRRLGDLAADTIVIHRDPAAAPRRAPSAPEAPPIVPPVGLTALEQRALIDFADRRRGWSRERSAELAELAGPLIGEARGGEAAERLAGMARHLVGHR